MNETEVVEDLFIGEPIEEAIEHNAQETALMEDKIKVQNIVKNEKNVIYSELQAIPFVQDTVGGIKIDFVGLFRAENMLNIFADLTSTTNYMLTIHLFDQNDSVLHAFEVPLASGYANERVKCISNILNDNIAKKLSKIKIEIQ